MSLEVGFTLFLDEYSAGVEVGVALVSIHWRSGGYIWH